jgi:hypothetical protein
MRVSWIGGWGVPPEALRPLAEKYFPGSQHTLLAPVREVATHPTGADADLTIAWSLGAWRVLEAASRGREFSGMVLLFAPFVAFPAEAGYGGKCSVTQVKFLRRWLPREPHAALADFYRRAGLEWMAAPAGPTNAPLPYDLPDLLEGLDRLAEEPSPALRAFAARGLPRNWQAFVGDDDPLLEAETVRRSLPGCVRLRDAGHDLRGLLRESGVLSG